MGQYNEDQGSVAPLATPSVASPSLANEPATPSMEDLVPGFGAFLDELGAYLEQHSPGFADEVARVEAERRVDYAPDIAALEGSQHSPDTREATKREAQTRPDTISNPLPQGDE